MLLWLHIMDKLIHNRGLIDADIVCILAVTIIFFRTSSIIGNLIVFSFDFHQCANLRNLRKRRRTGMQRLIEHDLSIAIDSNNAFIGRLR